VAGYFGTKWGIAVLRFAFALVDETSGSYRAQSFSFGWVLMGGALTLVGLAFMVGGVWWTGKAIRAMLRGEMVE